jgi:hypothetical protein
MGMLHSLPLVMDEVTNRMREVRNGDIEWINRLLMDITTGKGKERLEAATISERKNVATWSTIALLSSNTSIVDALRSRAYTTQGELMRMLELEMHDKLAFDVRETECMEALNRNYGVAGVRYIAWLVQNREAAKEAYKRTKAKLLSICTFNADERFWLHGLTAMLTGAVLAGSKYADVVDLPISDLAHFCVSVTRHSRKVAQDSEIDAVSVLGGFLQCNYGKLLILRKEANETKVRLGLSEITDESQARNEIKGRVEIDYAPGLVSIYLDRKEFYHHCSTVNYSSRLLKAQLTAKGYVSTETTKALFSDTRMHVSIHTKVLRIVMNADAYNGITGETDADK